MRLGFLTAVLIATVHATAIGAQPDFPLAKNGRPAATIVTAKQPTVVTTCAAAELQYHVWKITGALLPIVTDDVAVTGPRVLIGSSKAIDKLALSNKPQQTQEYAIRFLPNTLVILGKEPPVGEAVAALSKRAVGRFGQSLAFDGQRDQITTPPLDFNDEQGTFEAWVWLPKTTRKNPGTLLRLDGNGPWSYHILQCEASSHRISYASYDGKTVGSITSAELPAGWHHIAATYDATAGKMALYVDGALAGTASYKKTACHDATLNIGGLPTAGSPTIGNPFEGRIDDIRISKTVRKIERVDSPSRSDAQTILLLNCDEPSGPPQSSSLALTTARLPDPIGENGTLYGVYDFLERFCDVRWYAPGEIGVVCPKTPTLVVHGVDVQRAPVMKYRWITDTPLHMPGPPNAAPQRDVHLWKLRMRIGGQPYSVSHSFYGYYKRFLKDHPDWFAQGYTGEPPQLCYTNPDVIRQVVQDARDYFDGKQAHPGATSMGDVFGLVPMDNNSWCKCARCQAELNPAEKNNLQFTNGKASNYIFGFVNKVAREVRKTHPQKWIGALSYSDYAYRPTNGPVEPNVVVQMCLHTRNWWCPSMEANDRKVLREWREQDLNRPLYLWLYYNFPGMNAQSGNYHYFPGYFAHTVVSQMKMYHAANIQGMFIEHSSEFGESYLMDQLEFYVTMKLADDPTLDGNRLIDEFFTRYYGSAAAPMKEIYDLIEKTFTDPKGYPLEIQQSPAHHHQTPELAARFLGSKQRMDRLATLMAQARDAAKTPEEQQRVALFETGQWNYMLEGQKKAKVLP